MPKELTHWIIAQRSLDALDHGSETSILLREHYHLYLAGAVLPDTLLHLVRGPDTVVALDLADLFHDTGKNSYAPLISFEENSKEPLSPETKACLLGVLCHMQADIVFHPFVHSISGWDDIGRHYALETEIDCCLLRNGAEPPVRLMKEIGSAERLEIAEEVCRMLFDPQGRLSQGGVADALELHCKYQGMYDTLFWKMLMSVCGILPFKNLRQQRHLFYPLLGADRKKTLAGEGSWEHPVTGHLQKTTLKDLADLAVSRTAAFFTQFDGQKTFKSILEDARGENLLTGLYGVQKKKLKKMERGCQK